MRKRERLIVVSLLVAFLLQGEIIAEDAQYYFKRGHKFYLESKPAQAEVELKKALEINPKLSDAHYYLGSIYFKQERYNEAIKYCQEALKINPADLKSLLILGLSFQELRSSDEAIAAFQKAQTISPQSAAVHSALGLAYCAKKDLVQAKAEYTALKQLDAELADDLLERINELEAKNENPIMY